jgi:antirestriction protein ArdC
MKAYEILVEQVLEKLREWVIPWKQSWIVDPPKNFVSDTAYRGFNRLVLSLSGFPDPRFLTMKQVRKLWGKIRKWSKGVKIFFFTEREDEDGEKLYPVMRYYVVFNITQTSGISYVPYSKDISRTLQCKAQEIVTNYHDKPVIYTGPQASYNLLKDTITMPSLYKFKKYEDFFATLFHEFIHSTGNVKRLWRLWMQQVEHYGSESYSREELVAELGSMFLCHEAGITPQTFENSVAYIQWWLSYLENNPKELITASSFAQKASDYILWRNTFWEIQNA